MDNVYVALSLAFLVGVAHADSFKPFVIYGNDDRLDYYQEPSVLLRQTADATVALMKASTLTAKGPLTTIASLSYGQGMGLCAQERFFEQETAAFCSGFLVSNDTVVTAGHCIEDSSCSDTRFVFGFKVEAPHLQPKSVPTDHVFACKSVVHSVSIVEGEDFAVVKLDRPVTFVSPLLVRTSGALIKGDPVLVIGYPAGLPVKIAAGANVRALNDGFFTANLDTYGGNSGSAVFNAYTGLVEGVLVRGDMDYVYKGGCRISNVCSDTGCRGEDATSISRVLPYLQ